MSGPNLEAILNPARMLADGIPFSDYNAARQLEDASLWFGFWADTARRYEQLGEEALARGHHVSAGEWLWHASLSYHYAQFLWFHEPEQRETGQRHKAELYKRAAPYLVPRAERVELILDGSIVIPGYLRLPAGAGPHACAILVGGLESTKEESYLFENMCLRRGLATFAFDGPGQGEMFFDVKVRGDFERFTTAVIDYLAERPEIHGDRLGILGRSLGGHLALRSAAFDTRLRACVAWGVFYDMSGFEDMPPATKNGFLYSTGKASRSEALAHLEEALTIAGVVEEVRCPTYVVQGAHDRIFSTHQTELVRSGLAGNPRCEFVVEPDGDHCCHNMAQIVRPRMADWLAGEIAG